MLNPDSQDAIARRKEFYTNENVDLFLKRHGVPKSNHAMHSFVALGLGKNNSEVDGEIVKALSHVYFQVHSQQINIRDKANGKMIISIRK